VLIVSRKNLSEKTRDITDPLSIILTILLTLNFTADSILSFIGNVVGWIARVSRALLPILIGLVLATIILSVVFYWDKISTTVKLLFLAAVVLGALFIINGENIIFAKK
jgi:hypothetical protein